MFEYYRRAHECIAQGSLTNSKRVECLVKGVTPTHVTHGAGPYLYSWDKKKYIDFICALGTNLFGYANPHIVQAIQGQLSKGWLYSLGSTYEIEVAEKVKEVIPFASKIRFVKSGTEACMAAIRIACAHTGRSIVLSEGYHGWSDGFVSLTDPGLGVPPQPGFAKLLPDFSNITRDVACVIIEPISTEYSTARLNFIDDLIRKCRSTGTLVIFDEIITGFRWPSHTFSNDSGRRPDIICLGKAAAAGMPLGIIGIGRGIGETSEWFVSGSYAGELLSLVALSKTLDLLKNNYKLSELWLHGGQFVETFNTFWPEKIRIQGYNTRGIFVGDPTVKALLWQEACNAGILLGPSFFFNFAHIEHKDSVLGTLSDIIRRIQYNQVKLIGEMPASPFSQKVRENK